MNRENYIYLPETKQDKKGMLLVVQHGVMERNFTLPPEVSLPQQDSQP